MVAIYTLLKQAHANSRSNLSEFEWLAEVSKTSEMCFYWKMILNFQMQLLIFVRARGNLNCIYKLFIAFYHGFSPSTDTIMLVGQQFIGLI